MDTFALGKKASVVRGEACAVTQAIASLVVSLVDSWNHVKFNANGTDNYASWH